MTIVDDNGTVVQQGDTVHVENKTSRQNTYEEKLPAI